jgi:diguanylate cyclase (GGDEF)-like protein
MATNSLKQRELAILAREQKILLREAEITQREKALHLGENHTATKAACNALNQAQLIEANQNLVVASIRAQTMVEAAEQANARMSHMAEHDLLTGLPNRLLMTYRLEQSMTLAQRNNYQVALMFLDIDHFKNINDSLGHAIGDELLQSVAKRLQSCVRLSDTVSRYGGDEFVVLLSEVKDPQDATIIADKLLSVMAMPHHISGHLLHVTMSIGISLFPTNSKNPEALVRDADTAMYQAKKKGRNKYMVFTQDMNLRAVARQSIEQALHQALLNKEFVVYYQPKVNLKTGRIIGAEALIRWQRTQHSLIQPIDFVGVAEECGIILPIGHWVLREACRQTQVWLKAGLPIGRIAVNVSATEFHNTRFF